MGMNWSVAPAKERPMALLPERLEEGADLVYQCLGLFERGEVATGLHDAPALDVVGPFGDAAHRHDNFMRKGGYSRGDVDVTKQRSLAMGGLVVETSGGVDRLRDPVDHDVGEQFVFREGSLNVALTIAPGAELFDDPACQACGRVIESIGKRLGACALDTAIGSFVLLVVLPLCAPLLYFSTVAQAVALLWPHPGGDHVQVDADQVLWVGIAQARGDRAAPIASLRSEALIAQCVTHQVHEELGYTSDIHAVCARAF